MPTRVKRIDHGDWTEFRALGDWYGKPCWDDDQIVVPFHEGADCDLVAVSVATGEIQWVCAPWPEGSIGPTLHGPTGGTVLAACGRGRSVVAVDRSSGAVRWRRGAEGGASIDVAAAANGLAVLKGPGRWMGVVDPETGGVLHEATANDALVPWDGVALVSGSDLAAVDRAGTVLWRSPHRGSMPEIDEIGRVWTSIDGRQVCEVRPDGDLVPSALTLSGRQYVQGVTAGHAMVIDPDVDPERARVVDLATGEVHWDEEFFEYCPPYEVKLGGFVLHGSGPFDLHTITDRTSIAELGHAMLVPGHDGSRYLRIDGAEGSTVIRIGPLPLVAI